MASAKLLRQYVGDYNKKLAAEQGAYQDRYAGYKTQYDAYTQQANAYNQKIEQFNATGAAMTPGDIYQNENGTLTQFDQKGNPVAYSPPQGGWGIPDESGNTTSTGAPYKGANGLWYQDVMQTTQGGYDEYGRPVPPTTTKIDTQYIPVKAFHPGAAPTAPAEPAAPAEVKRPNLTQNDIREMQNPGLNQAQLAMSAARGYIGKSELAGDAAPTSNSAFADLKGDDPNNLKDKGLLAQAVAGQI